MSGRYYSNSQIPEGINTSAAHPALTFLKLIVAFVLIVAISGWLLGKSGGYVFSLVPFEKEVELAALYPDDIEETNLEMQDYLGGLIEKIVQAMNLPKVMKIHVHYVEDETKNAFATLGGHLFVHKGLLSQLSNENTITMLLAHEVAHIKHRDPIRSLGQELAISSGMALLLGKSDIRLLGKSGLYTNLKFSREMELSCDREAVNALVAIYGHANGASELFHVLASLTEDELIQEPDFFVTHPQSENRIAEITALVTKAKWSTSEETVALPDEFNLWLE